MTTLETKLLTQASAYAPLTSLLGSSASGQLAWYEARLSQGTGFPAIVVLLISNPQMYVDNGRLSTSRARVQFTIWDGNPETARAVESALFSFLDNFNAINSASLPAYPNEVVNVRESMYPEYVPPMYQRIVDAMIFQNQTL